MDPRPLKYPPSDRFTSLFTPPSSSSSGPTPSSSFPSIELTEDDVFSTLSDDVVSPPSTSSSPKPLNPTGSTSFNRAGSFGILVALPESQSQSPNPKPVLKPTTSSLSSSSSATRMIPAVPKRATAGSSSSDRSVSVSSLRYHQSAPVRVPLMVRRRGKSRVRDGGFGYDDDDGEEEREEEDEEEEEGKGMLPPHEIVARKEAMTPVVSCSVLEGAGRTLKGRDLRMVRNAVFRKTGFID